MHIHTCVYTCIESLLCAGVGGIEAEAVMLGQCISMVLPQVIRKLYVHLSVMNNDAISGYVHMCNLFFCLPVYVCVCVCVCVCVGANNMYTCIG